MADPSGDYSARRAFTAQPSAPGALHANAMQPWADTDLSMADLSPGAQTPAALSLPSSPKASSQRPRWSLSASGGAQGNAVSRYCSARRQLQAALCKLELHPNDPGSQQEAHQAHIALTQRKVPFLYRGMPGFNEAMKIGCSGPLPALGIWRTLAFELAINGWTLGVKASFKDIQRAIVQWAVGAVTGVVGEAAMHKLATAWIESVSTRFRAVHPAATVTDLMVAKMNRIRPGWGDEVRAEIVRRQQAVSQIGSDLNSPLAMGAFAGSAAVRCIALPPGSDPHLIDSVTVSNLPPTLAGIAVGVAITCNMVRAQIRVPRMETLNRVLARPRQERSEHDAMVDAQTLPLFYVHRAAESPLFFPGMPHANNSFRPSHWTFGTSQRTPHRAHSIHGVEPPRALLLSQQPVPTTSELMKTSEALSTAVGVFALTRLLIKALAVQKASDQTRPE